MQITSLELSGFKSFSKKTVIQFDSAITSIVGPNGSGKSNVAEAIRFVLGEQSIKSMRGKQGTDLIFKGSSSLSPMGRASVTVIFDNKKHNKNIEIQDGVFTFLQYDQIRITREIYADGLNEYLINDTKVRLKDIQELLSTVGIGTSGHHIISQGEADKVLNANARERKEMIEDALGLKLYQWRIKDAEKKLEKTDNHLREGELARKEIAPHLQFLKRQVEKIEQRRSQSEELAQFYSAYLGREKAELESEEKNIKELGGSFSLEKKLSEILTNIKDTEYKISQKSENQSQKNDISLLENEVSVLQRNRDDLYKNVLRYDAEETVLQKSLLKSREYEELIKSKIVRVSIEKERALSIREELRALTDQIKWRLEKNEFKELPGFLQLTVNTTHSFFSELLDNTEDTPYILADGDNIEKEISVLYQDRKTKQIDLELIDRELSSKKVLIKSMLLEIDKNKETSFEEERSLFEQKSQVLEIQRDLDRLKNRESVLSQRTARMYEEIEEGTAIIGSKIDSYSDKDSISRLDEKSQSELHKLIQRLKIKLEDSGVSNVADILKEHDESSERDAFLAKEINDLYSSKQDIIELINNLKSKLDELFTVGVENINKEFNIFFTEMFGGGSASLSIVEKEKRSKRKTDDIKNILENLEEEENETEAGIEVSVNLPQKKVRDLSMLSGGERALTSIALLFAISQVNPPPFMVLDETDAALDEANARRYGKSLKTLSGHSKLIVITHNRETMNQANTLYGVTVGKDGASKILSVRFDEASEYAK